MVACNKADQPREALKLYDRMRYQQSAISISNQQSTSAISNQQSAVGFALSMLQLVWRLTLTPLLILTLTLTQPQP